MSWRNGTAGVTLIELMIALVIAAVLAAIAVPSYRSYVLRTQRTEATAALLRIQAAEEKHFLQHNRYTDELTAAPPAGLGIGAVSETGLYALEVRLSEDGPLGFVISARPRPEAAQREDRRCALFTLDQNGLRRAFDSEGTDRTDECWR